MKRLLPILLIACLVAAENGSAQAPSEQGFVRIPEGPLLPGCTVENFNARAADDVSRGLFVFEVWQKDEKPVTLPAFRLQKYELTNAQWKLYLDRKFRVSLKTTGQQTLESLATEYVRHGDEPIPGQWAPIYALNWKTVYEGLKGKADKNNKPLWDPNWKPESPGQGLKDVFLPEGLELHFYRHVVPKHWYGWNRISGLSSGKEYVEVTAAPKDAFLVPDDEMFKTLRLRARDFKSYPMRDVAPLEALRMAEWAGCSLPSEYELERAMRGAAPNSKQNPGKADWDHNKQKDWFAFADNPKVSGGPLAVDDPSMAAGDSEFGCRNLLGNVWELTRTFWDLHPFVKPKPDPTPSDGLFNYALVAKGGAWGSGWRQLQISTRTGKIGNAALDLKYLNRADSLGLRLARHEQPGLDLMTHTIRRMAFNSRLGMWEPVPHAFAMPRLTGADVTHFVDSTAEDGYCFIQEQALGIAMAPLWVAKIDKTTVGRHKKIWNNVKQEKTDFIYLGILRIDVPFKAGTQLTGAAWAKLQQDRKEYLKLKRAIEMANKKKKKGEQPDPLPEEPPAPDKYEEATEKQADTAGVWRETTLEAGEYHVVYWYGFVGLIGRSKRMPPLAILIPEECKRERRVDSYKGRTKLDPKKDQVEMEFVVEEWNKAKPQTTIPPGPAQSDLWALSLTLPNGWPNRNVEKAGWRFKLVISTVEGVLAKHEWNTETK